MFKRLGREAGDLVEHKKKKVLNKDSIRYAIKIILPGELAKFAIEFADNSTVKFTQEE